MAAELQAEEEGVDEAGIGQRFVIPAERELRRRQDEEGRGGERHPDDQHDRRQHDHQHGQVDGEDHVRGPGTESVARRWPVQTSARVNSSRTTASAPPKGQSSWIRLTW